MSIAIAVNLNSSGEELQQPEGVYLHQQSFKSILHHHQRFARNDPLFVLLIAGFIWALLGQAVLVIKPGLDQQPVGFNHNTSANSTDSKPDSQDSYPWSILVRPSSSAVIVLLFVILAAYWTYYQQEGCWMQLPPQSFIRPVPAGSHRYAPDNNNEAVVPGGWAYVFSSTQVTATPGGGTEFTLRKAQQCEFTDRKTGAKVRKHLYSNESLMHTTTQVYQKNQPFYSVDLNILSLQDDEQLINGRLDAADLEVSKPSWVLVRTYLSVGTAVFYWCLAKVLSSKGWCGANVWAPAFVGYKYKESCNSKDP